MVKVFPHVMRNINEFDIPAGDEHGYEILYFGVNLRSVGTQDILRKPLGSEHAF